MTRYGICPLSIIPIRTKPTDNSEMVSQALFGETFQILEDDANWAKIRCSWDEKEGWISNRQFLEIKKEEYEIANTFKAYTLEYAQPAIQQQHFLPLLMGSTLPNYDGMSFRFKNQRYSYSGQIINPKEVTPSIELIIKIARRYLFAPYLLGGRSPFGIDPAGFIQMVYLLVGINLPRKVNHQAKKGRAIGFIDETRPTDVAFFENEKRRVTHAGIILPEQKIIHVAGQVRIDSLDHYGIFNTDANQYTHKLRVVKRYYK